MTDHKNTIETLYTSAEAATLDIETFVSCFGQDGYARDIPSQREFRGSDIALVASGMAEAFPDIHRELFSIDVSGDTVVVELAIRGTHRGTLMTPEGPLAATGKVIDVPCCDVFRMKDGKVAAFHCYNASPIMQQQLS
ncbi:nuclear transport factor 2 family protein [Salipiger sp. PrR002]|uniref:nuclear transport factor 2 family protein n=1 Tax=Salipiger sp. PrR002 TaxID=2706489 RepID=UPI0013BE7C55|nr:ester cyclase [Salipiger sp. PrR002]NDV98791.1 ester cyclase [Salipiger sp. PrR002]NDW55528.1 ester cyclase [Salipiger sp. PrR004]